MTVLNVAKGCVFFEFVLSLTCAFFLLLSFFLFSSCFFLSLNPHFLSSFYFYKASSQNLVNRRSQNHIQFSSLSFYSFLLFSFRSMPHPGNLLIHNKDYNFLRRSQRKNPKEIKSPTKKKKKENFLQKKVQSPLCDFFLFIVKLSSICVPGIKRIDRHSTCGWRSIT